MHFFIPFNIFLCWWIIFKPSKNSMAKFVIINLSHLAAIVPQQIIRSVSGSLRLTMSADSKILITLALESAALRHESLSINWLVVAARSESFACHCVFIGSFFERYPRHRVLISINKRSTGRRNREFNSRHDWNSLLNDDPRLQFARYSQDFFPQVSVRQELNGSFT